MPIPRTVEQYLKKHQVPFSLQDHPRSFSSRELADTASVREDHIAKAVMLNDDRGFVMVVLPANGWVKLKTLQQELDRDLEFTSEPEGDSLFPDCQSGAYPPLGPAYGIETVLDLALTSLAYIYFEAGDHKHLVRVDGPDFLRLLSGVREGHFSHFE